MRLDRPRYLSVPSRKALSTPRGKWVRTNPEVSHELLKLDRNPARSRSWPCDGVSGVMADMNLVVSKLCHLGDTVRYAGKYYTVAEVVRPHGERDHVVTVRPKPADYKPIWCARHRPAREVADV